MSVVTERSGRFTAEITTTSSGSVGIGIELNRIISESVSTQTKLTANKIPERMRAQKRTRARTRDVSSNTIARMINIGYRYRISDNILESLPIMYKEILTNSMSVSQLQDITSVHVVIQSLLDEIRRVVSCQLGHPVRKIQ